MIRDARMLGGTRHPHDARAARELVHRDLERSPSFASATNHFSISEGDEGKVVAADIKVPTLVIHGTSDPLFRSHMARRWHRRSRERRWFGSKAADTSCTKRISLRSARRSSGIPIRLEDQRGRRHNATPMTPSSAAARPYQVRHIAGGCWAGRRCVTPPTGMPPGLGVGPASMKNCTIRPGSRPARRRHGVESFQ